MIRCLVTAGLLLLTLAACSATPPVTPASEAPTTPPWILDDVETIAVLGDSIALGTNACGRGACSDASWVVSDAPDVGSLRSRVRSVAPDIVVRSLARDGASIGTALHAVDLIVESGADLVIVTLGANDACAPRLSGMTSADDYGTILSGIITRVREGLPDARFVVMSVLDINDAWELQHRDPDAIAVWRSSSSCDSLLSGADSDSAEAVDRRAQVAERVDAYNVRIEEICTATPECYVDGGALHAIEFVATDLSPLDRFHPSRTGQARIAASVWATLEGLAAAP